MKTSVSLPAALLLSSALAMPAMADVTYAGQDDGSAVGGAMPNSTAAGTTFLAAASAYGNVSTLNFDDDATSDVSSYSYPGVTITKTVSGGSEFFGITDANDGNLYGYDQSAGGSGKWFGFPTGSATFTFTAPTNSFGFYTSGTQLSFGEQFDILIGGTTYTGPINNLGGAGFFGFTSDTGFSSVTITRSGNDAWGIDNVSFNAAGVPEPATWGLMILGFGAVGGAMRRRTAKVAYAI